MIVTDEKQNVTKVTIKGKGKPQTFLVYGDFEEAAVRDFFDALPAKVKEVEAKPRKARGSKTPSEMAAA